MLSFDERAMEPAVAAARCRLVEGKVTGWLRRLCVMIKCDSCGFVCGACQGLLRTP